MEQSTVPAAPLVQGAPHLTLAPAYTDPKTGAVYVHEDLELAILPWEGEQHISPMSRAEGFGDVESWVAYVQRYGVPASTLLTWSDKGLCATLDYAEDAATPGRCQWQALHPFVFSRELQAWQKFAGGQSQGQRAAIEFLEERSEDIVEPVANDLVTLLRSLRANVASKASAELRPDGTSSVSFASDRTIQAGTGQVELPPVMTIDIPILHGLPERFRLFVRVRVSVGDQAQLALRFSLTNAEPTIDTVLSERVEAAQALLGDQYQMLRWV